MPNLLSMIGYIGTGLVIGAYAPQISHLWTEHCSAGISERAYAIWALAAAVFLGHSTVIGDAVFMVTQLVNMVALAIILVLARRFRNQICAAHARQLHVEGRPQMSNQNTHTERKNEADGATRIFGRGFQIRLMQGPRRQRS